METGRSNTYRGKTKQALIWYVSIDSCCSCMLWHQSSKETKKTHFQTPHAGCDCLLSFLFCRPPSINPWQIELTSTFSRRGNDGALQKHKSFFFVASLKNCFMRIIRDGNCSGHGLGNLANLTPGLIYRHQTLYPSIILIHTELNDGV